ncbi:MAG: LssY C-terminal domain-containing protein, partial [Actinomyces sp.]
MTSSEVTRPRPTAPPVYRDGPSKMSEVDARSWSIDDVLDAVFFAIAAVATLWLAWLLIGSGWHLDAVLVVNSLLFWAVLAYLALPRLHQVLTWLYVPDYFIGRTRTPDGLLGDPVNLAVKGDEEDIHEAMVAAGWVRADPITLRTSWRIIVSSLLRRSYPAAPVSNLMLFGRKQSFAYQKEVEGNPAQRHHIRFWYCPPGWSLPGGGHVDWLAAATYDRAVGLSALTLQVTHKIDADIDIERNYVVDDVRWANETAELQIWPDFFTSYHDKNGGGDRVVTDGALHVLDLNEV